MTTPNDDSLLPISDETLSDEKQDLSPIPVQVNVPVERPAPSVAEAEPEPIAVSVAPIEVDVPAPVPESDLESPDLTEVIIAPEELDDPVPAPTPALQPEAVPVPSNGDPVEVPEDDISGFSFPPSAPIDNAELKRPAYGELKNKESFGGLRIELPADTNARTQAYLAGLPRQDVEATQAGADWLAGFGDGSVHGWYSDFGASVAQRPTAKWKQSLYHGDRELCAASPKLGDDGPVLSGERGLLRMNHMLGRGSIVQIPLWHSGFWVTIRRPEEAELLDLEERIVAEKILLGRQTHGLVFANNSVYIVNALTDLFFQCIYETSIKDLKDLTQLRGLIKAPDIHAMAWGLALAIYPRGFPYVRSMLDEKGIRTDMIEELLNVAALQVVDDNSIDDWQRAHMGIRKSGAMAINTITMYQEKFVHSMPKSYPLNDAVSVELKTPSLEEYIASGYAWVDEVSRLITRAFTEGESVESRNQLMFARGKALAMRQYAHYIHKFVINKDYVMEEKDTIIGACNQLSSDNELRPKFFQVVNQYLTESLVSIIATPLVAESERKLANPKFPWMLPIDPLSVFTSLLSQLTLQIRLRQ